MTFRDLLVEWGKDLPQTLSIATSGLKETDEIIAVSVRTLPNNDSLCRANTQFKQVNEELILPAQQYHKISVDTIRYNGRSKTYFDDFLTNRLKNEKSILFTYNIPFHISFLTRELNDMEPGMHIYDMSVIERAIDSKYAFSAEDLASFDSMYNTACNNFTALPVNSICKKLNISKESSAGQYPVERAGEILSELYFSFASKEISMLPS